jgi:hypothetical protein
MEKKHTLILDKEFILYCELNNIKDVNKIANETFNRGFSLLKYGETPSGNSVEKEKIIEVIKEIPVEKIVYQEVIKEVEIEKIVEVIKEIPIEIVKEVPIEVKGETQVITQDVIKEIIVEKIIDDYECKNMLITLTESNRKLKEELEILTNVLNKFNKGSYMKNSDLNNLYDE